MNEENGQNIDGVESALREAQGLNATNELIDHARRSWGA